MIVAVRRIDLPTDADWITALRATPSIVVVLLDLLDLSLDFLAAEGLHHGLDRLRDYTDGSTHSDGTSASVKSNNLWQSVMQTGSESSMPGSRSRSGSQIVL